MFEVMWNTLYALNMIFVNYTSQLKKMIKKKKLLLIIN